MKFKAWAGAVNFIGMLRSDQETARAHHFLITIDLSEGIRVRTFRAREYQEALDDYAAAESEIGARTDVQVVLASASSFDAIEAAFPAYFNDASVFLEALDRALS